MGPIRLLLTALLLLSFSVATLACAEGSGGGPLTDEAYFERMQEIEEDYERRGEELSDSFVELNEVDEGHELRDDVRDVLRDA